MKLKKTQKNQLFDILEDAGLPISLFEFQEVEFKLKSKKPNTSIKVINQPYHFTFWDDNGVAYLYSPGEDWYEVDGDATDFNELLNEFQVWINCLTEELEAEDKWANFSNILTTLNFTDDSKPDNDKFSAAEYLEVNNRIKTLKANLDELKLEDEQLNVINKKLDFIADQAAHLGKFDWRSLFIGTTVSIILQLSLSQEQGRLLWEIIKRIFSNYFIGQQ